MLIWYGTWCELAKMELTRWNDVIFNMRHLLSLCVCVCWFRANVSVAILRANIFIRLSTSKNSCCRTDETTSSWNTCRCRCWRTPFPESIRLWVRAHNSSFARTHTRTLCVWPHHERLDPRCAAFGTGCTLTVVSRSTQPSALRGTENDYQPQDTITWLVCYYHHS